MAFLDYGGLTRFTNKIKTWVNNLIDTIKPVRSINSITPDDNGDVGLHEVDYAGNLTSDDGQYSTGSFIVRTSGGAVNIADGDAFVSGIYGASTHDDYVAEVIDMTVTNDPEHAEGTEIRATIDKDTFRSAASDSGEYTIVYEDGWSADPSEYGITVDGTPIDGDSITVEYTKEYRGHIINSTPTSFVSTGWNLYNHDLGYAKVLRYNSDLGFIIQGDYTGIAFKYDPTDEESETITVTEGAFQVPADGYVIVTGGNSTNTAIYMTWTDWVNGTDKTFEPYSETTISLSQMMNNFEYGLCQVGATRDYIDFNLRIAVSYIGRTDYSESNLEEIISQNYEYTYDLDYIYYVKRNPDQYNFDDYTPDLDGSYTVSDHGMEMFTGTEAPCYTSIIYGQNLKDKLRNDVLTISEQTLNTNQKAQVLSNLGINFQRVRFGKQMTTATLAQFIADIKTYTESNIIILYTVSATVGSELYPWISSIGNSATTAYGTAIVFKSSNNYAQYFYFGSYYCGRGNIDLSNNTVSEKRYIPFFTSANGTNYVNSFADKSVASGSVVNLGSITLPQGRYYLQATAVFPENTTGERRLMFSNTSTGTQYERYSYVNVRPAINSETVVQLPWVTDVAADGRTVYLNVKQSSGSPMTITGVGIKVTRLAQ